MVRIKIAINKEKLRIFHVPLHKPVVEIVHEQVEDAGQVVSIKKLNNFYGNFVPCEKSYLVSHKNEQFIVVTKEKR